MFRRSGASPRVVGLLEAFDSDPPLWNVIIGYGADLIREGASLGLVEIVKYVNGSRTVVDTEWALTEASQTDLRSHLFPQLTIAGADLLGDLDEGDRL